MRVLRTIGGSVLIVVGCIISFWIFLEYIDDNRFEGYRLGTPFNAVQQAVILPYVIGYSLAVGLIALGPVTIFKGHERQIQVNY